MVGLVLDFSSCCDRLPLAVRREVAERAGVPRALARRTSNQGWPASTSSTQRLGSPSGRSSSRKTLADPRPLRRPRDSSCPTPTCSMREL